MQLFAKIRSCELSARHWVMCIAYLSGDICLCLHNNKRVVLNMCVSVLNHHLSALRYSKQTNTLLMISPHYSAAEKSNKNHAPKIKSCLTRSCPLALSVKCFSLAQTREEAPLDTKAAGNRARSLAHHPLSLFLCVCVCVCHD